MIFLACIFISYEACFTFPGSGSSSSGGRSGGMMKKSMGGSSDGGKAGKAAGLSKLSQNSSGGSGSSPSTPPTPPTDTPTPPVTPPTPSGATPPAGTTPPTTPTTPTTPAVDAAAGEAKVDASVAETTSAEQHEANVQNDTNIMQKLASINEQDISNRQAIEALSYNLLFNNFINLKNFINSNFTKAQFQRLCMEFIDQIFPENSENLIDFGKTIVAPQPTIVTAPTTDAAADNNAAVDETPATEDTSATDDAAQTDASEVE